MLSSRPVNGMYGDTQRREQPEKQRIRVVCKVCSAGGPRRTDWKPASESCFTALNYRGDFQGAGAPISVPSRGHSEAFSKHTQLRSTCTSTDRRNISMLI